MNKQMTHSQIFRFQEYLKDEDGQSLIEFLFLFLIMLMLSFVMLNNMSSGVAKRWTSLIKIISSPTDSVIN